MDGVSVVYFRFTHLLSRSRYVGDIFLDLYTKRRGVMVTVYVIIFVVCVACGIMKGREKMKPGAGI